MNLEKQPRFLRDFSKENSAKERQEAAQAIRTQRQEYFKRQDREATATQEQERNLEIQLQRIETLKETIAELSQSGPKKIWNFFKLEKLRADKIQGEQTYAKLIQEKDESHEKKETEEQWEKDRYGMPIEMSSARGLLNNFYSQEKQKWANSDANPKEIEKYFTEEHLSSLSLKDYGLLMERFPNEMVTHVTRQGIRDHIGHAWSSGGMGKHYNGFKELIADGRLRSLLGKYVIQEEKERAIADYIQLFGCKTQEEAEALIKEMLEANQSNQASFADKMAIHVAAEEVADEYYGAERNNEVFFAFPSAFIASQYRFSGQLNKPSGGVWNDQWVWANEERGIDINAGITFIPADAKVDPVTGSRYQLDEQNEAIINQENLDVTEQFVNSEDFDTWAEKILDFQEKNGREAPQAKNELTVILAEKYNIKDPKLQQALSDPVFLYDMRLQKKIDADNKRGDTFLSGSLPERIFNYIRKVNLLYQETSSTIPSQQYWEKYFTDHPEHKPSKIVYYSGGDPTKALKAWRGGFKKSKEPDIGFPEHRVDMDSAEAMRGSDRFRDLASKAIEKYFPAAPAEANEVLVEN